MTDGNTSLFSKMKMKKYDQNILKLKYSSSTQIFHQNEGDGVTVSKVLHYITMIHLYNALPIDNSMIIILCIM